MLRRLTSLSCTNFWESNADCSNWNLRRLGASGNHSNNQWLKRAIEPQSAIWDDKATDVLGTRILRLKHLREELWFDISRRRDYINITDQIEMLVRHSGVQNGLCLVNAMHITASVYINDAEQGLIQDYDQWLEKLAPHEPVSQYRHNQTGEDNGDAHLKRQVMGREVVVAITDGRLDFGPWEQIYYAEFDG